MCILIQREPRVVELIIMPARSLAVKCIPIRVVKMPEELIIIGALQQIAWYIPIRHAFLVEGFIMIGVLQQIAWFIPIQQTMVGVYMDLEEQYPTAHYIPILRTLGEGGYMVQFIQLLIALFGTIHSLIPTSKIF